jgi:thiamine biosynthesis lipoprotein
MAVTTALTTYRRAAYRHLGAAERTFRCCDTTFLVTASGYRADATVERARETALTLESQLDAFDPGSAVSRLNEDGVVENHHVAWLVRRGLEYHERTGGVFDVHQGRVEHDLKAYLRGDRATLPATFDGGSVAVDGDRVTADGPVDLNGLAKGYVVDRAAAELAGVGRRGFVSGGGDMTPPTGAVAVESPYGDADPITVLDTDWNVATSGGYRRRRGDVDHVYDPTTGRLGARQDSVTVVAARDCTEADALATVLAALPVDRALELVASWPGAEALLVTGGVVRRSAGFGDHEIAR